MDRCFVTILFIVSAAGSMAEEPRGLLPVDYYKEITPGQLALSPDGHLLAFTVTTVVEDKNKRHDEVWMAELRGGEFVGKPFRFTDPEVESSAPVWSPDGNVLSFQSKRGENENETWFIRVTAPGGEAYQIDGVEGAPVWSLDGKWIAYIKEPEDEEDEAKEGNTKSGESEKSDESEDKDGSKSDDKPEEKKKDEHEGWISPESVTNTLDKKRFDGRVITQMNYKSDGTLTLMPHRSARNKEQLFVVSAEGGEAVQITDLPYDVSAPVWTADSRTLVFQGDEKQDDEYDIEPTDSLYAVSREGGEVRTLTANPGAERSPAISPNGGRLAYLSNLKRGGETDVMVVDIAPNAEFRGQPRNLTVKWALDPGAPDWAGSNSSVRFSSVIGGNVHLFEADGGGVKQITKGDRYLRAFTFSKSGGRMAYTIDSAMAPAKVSIASRNGSDETRVTSFNDEWLKDITLAAPERIVYTVSDGTQIEGWVVPPIAQESSKQYPMVLKIHGGPHASYGNTWFPTFHILSGTGMYVLYTNPRGSGGYGHDFMYATRGKWGVLDSEDYLRGVDAALAKFPAIDPERIGVSGGSYGGFMTAWLSATTNRFAAANPSRMIANWESWFGASDAQGLTEFEFFDFPWKERDLYRNLSPLSYVANVTIPTLIIEAEEDYRTPMAEGEQWFMALKKRNVPVELVRYPRSSHGLSRTGEPWLLVDRVERIKSWFVHWLIEEKATRPKE